MRIVVNHFTQMKKGSSFVCVAGLPGESHVRPVLEFGRLDRSLRRSQGGAFALGSVVELGPTKPRPSDPEVEDVVFNRKHARHRRSLEPSEFLGVLDSVAEVSLADIFGPDLEALSRTAAAVPKGKGRASLGVIKVEDGAGFDYRETTGIRFGFKDPSLGELALWATDIRLREANQSKPSVSSIRRVADRLSSGSFLSLGLTRAYQARAYSCERHWLQGEQHLPHRRSTVGTRLTKPMAPQANLALTVPSVRKSTGRWSRRLGIRDPRYARRPAT